MSDGNLPASSPSASEIPTLPHSAHVRSYSRSPKEGGSGVAAREYACVLLRNRPSGIFNAGGLERVGELALMVDLKSAKSRMHALAIAMRQFRAKNENVEQYGLEVYDEDGVLLNTLEATREDLRLYNSGYRENVAEGTPPSSLAEYADDQLLAELQRRLGRTELRTPGTGTMC
jgi:hypothetical protein